MKSTLLLLALIFYQSTNAQNIQGLYEKLNTEYATPKKALITLDSLIMLEPFNYYWLVRKAYFLTELKNYDQALIEIEKAVTKGYINYDYLNHFATIDEIRYNTTFNSLYKKLSKYRVVKSDDLREQEFIVDVPELIECYAIMLYLGNPEHTLINQKQNHSYFEKIDDYFSKHKSDPLVLELANRYPNKDWVNNLRGHHNIRTLYAFNGLDINTVDKVPIELDMNLAKLVKQFADKSNFAQFYKQNKEFYDSMTKIIQTNYAFGSNIISFFNENFKERINKFNVYFSPIYGGWQHGPNIRLENYIESFYFGGVMYTNTKEFYYPDVIFLFTLITEFDHTPINALTSKFSNELSGLGSKTEKLNTSKHISYGTITATINEYLTWAFALQFFYENTHSEYVELKAQIVKIMNNRGFSMFNEFLLFYETEFIKNKSQYPILEDFYPEVINWIKRI